MNVGSKNRLVGDDVFTVPGFLSASECDALIDLSERHGYAAATVNTADGHHMQSDWRNNMRVMLDDREHADMLWNRARRFVPASIGDWNAVGVNERLRFYRYDPGHLFDWHTDGFHRSDDGECSMLTFMVYLNGGVTGGETSFSDNRTPPRYDDFSVTPVAGLALFFRHHLLHKGEPVVDGRKYVLRTDVMYEERQ